MKWIQPERVAHALHNLSQWRSSVRSQSTPHLFPLLALLHAAAGNLEEVQFDEKDDFDFWDRYFRIEDGDSERPYFQPILLKRAEKNYPHSNAATIRKNTFQLKWRAAERDRREGHDFWKLSDDYSIIFRDKVLRRQAHVTRVPLLDLAVIIYREREFDAGTSVGDLERMFREDFPQLDSDYERIFSFQAESEENVFRGSKPLTYDEAILDALLPENVEAGDIPADRTLAALQHDDAILQQVQELLELGTSGIVLTGPPGTGKSYYAHRIAQNFVGHSDLDIFRVQFHPSYGYEDFVEGFKPEDTAKSGFSVVDKVFINACNRARKTAGWVVLIVDEINRGDPARVFGELLTYIERSYREKEFTLPFSGKPFSVPNNLMLIGTMNPHDRSVSHVDAAFVRRFDHIEIPPSRDVVEQSLETSGNFTSEQAALVGDWFDQAQGLVSQGLGHSFFVDVKSIDQLKLIWKYRLLPTARTAIELDEGRLSDLTRSFEALLRRLEGVIGEA